MCKIAQHVRQAFRRMLAPTNPSPDQHIKPVSLTVDQKYVVHFADSPALASMRRLLNQDSVRPHIGYTRTYLNDPLCHQVAKMLPEEPAKIILTVEQWVLISQAITTYEIIQDALGEEQLLPGTDPHILQINLHLLKRSNRKPLHFDRYASL